MECMPKMRDEDYGMLPIMRDEEFCTEHMPKMRDEEYGIYAQNEG